MKKSIVLISIMLFFFPLVAEAANSNTLANTEKKDYVRLGSMEIIGRIEAPTVSLDLIWQAPKFLSRSMELPMRTFGKETFDNFPGKSFFKYKKNMQRRRRVMMERYPG